jgi:formyl-CoA transferase
MPAPLQGIRVVELTTMITGPLAGMMLADLGASVIKIENPDKGDPYRTFRGEGSYSGHFICYNRNKRSLALDLRSTAGQAAFVKLIRRSDVLIDNFRTGVLDRLGLAPDRLRKENPALIHASITGFGAKGPYRNRPAYDAVAQALSGVSAQFLDSEAPQVTGPTLSDNITGIYTAQAILAALFERTRTGQGKRIETNMLEATIAFAPDAFINFKRHGLKSTPQTRAATSQSYAFRCGDGQLIAVHLSSQPKFWEGLLNATRRYDLAGHPLFSSRESRVANYAQLAQELAQEFLTRPRDEWGDLLEKNDVPYAPVLNAQDLINDPQIQELGTFYQVHHPVEGEVWGIQPPYLFDGERAGAMQAPPTLGQHTEEILAELDTRETSR